MSSDPLGYLHCGSLGVSSLQLPVVAMSPADTAPQPETQRLKGLIREL